MIQKILLTFMMNLPDFIKLFLSRKKQINLHGRKLLPSFQLMLSMSENENSEIDYSSLSASDFRKNYDQPNPMSFYSKKSDNLETLDHHVEVEDGSIKVRQYISKNSSEKSLLYFHGGGFTSGNLESHDNLCKYLSYLLGINIFSVDYRRSPEYKFPIPLNDCHYAYEWLIANAEGFGVDPLRIYTGGDSAGGNFSAALCLIRKESNKSMPFGQLLFYPVTDLRYLTESYKLYDKGFLLTGNMMRWFVNNYITNNDAMNPLASPLLAEDFTGLPPSVIVTAGFDPLRDEGYEYAQKLKLSGIDVIYKEQPGFIHAFAQFGVIPECRSAIKEACLDLVSLSKQNEHV
ncbi:MAG: alpha/beta hydrolase [SAR86 cluster bacterium]|jgi:acetyl esterase|nr:alpha/beta hydrolase [SAR86 cluster bacterium]